MTQLSNVRGALVAIAALSDARSDEAAVLAGSALASLDGYLEQRRQSPSRLLAGVDENCITRCTRVSEAAYELRARLGAVEVSDYAFGDPETQSDDAILEQVRGAVLDSLRVEVVRRRVLEASDRDLLDALDAAERGGDDEVGEIAVAAHERGIRRL